MDSRAGAPLTLATKVVVSAYGPRPYSHGPSPHPSVRRSVYEIPPLLPSPPVPTPHRAIIVMGVSGCGKSTLGALLAHRLDCRFLEGDSFHSAQAVAKMQSGQPLTDADRWPWLDRLGAASVTAVAADGMVVTACSALRRSYRDRLRAAIGPGTCFLFLDNGRDELLHRLQNRPGHYMPASLLDSQLATLERPEADEVVLTLPGEVAASAQCDAALDWLQRAARQTG